MTQPVAGVTVGSVATLERTFTSADLAAFAALSGDDNPVHLDADYAATTRFGRPIVHGILVAGLVSALIGTELPGEGSIYLSQTLRFERPVHVGSRVTARVEVTRVREDKPIVTLATTVLDADGNVAVSGEAVVLVERPAAGPAGAG